MKEEKVELSSDLIVTEHPIQSALCQMLEGSDKVDLEGLTESLLPLILEERSLEDLAMERAKQIVGGWITRMNRLAPDGKEMPAYLKTSHNTYKPISKVTTKDLDLRKDQLDKKRRGIGVGIEKLTDIGHQLGLPGISNFEPDRDYDSQAERHFLEKAQDRGLELTHNKEVGRYRIDFTVVEDGNPTHCNISILGEKWHKKKLPRDFARMRELTKEGELMIPFTAKQILSDPDRCVTEVKSIYSKWREALLN